MLKRLTHSSRSLLHTTRVVDLRRSWLGALGLAVLLVGCTTEEPVATAGAVETASEPTLSLHSVSAQPWLVSGGDVLLEIRSTSGDAVTPQIFVGDQLVSEGAAGARLVATAGGRWQILLSDLPIGDSLVSARLPGTSTSAQLQLTNYPLSGPIISGPHETPFYCQTEQFVTVTGESLGPPLDSDCSLVPRVDYVYWSTTAEDFLPYTSAESGNEPEDLGELLNHQGDRVPYIVRVETGVVNRAIYEIAMLHDPRRGTVTPWRRSANWNGKLIYTHGGGCRSGWYQQGDATGGVMRDGLLRQGYALVSASLNVFGQNCNDLLASETHIMVKERFIEHYGEPIFTIGTGASGGSYQSHQTADNYPGVFDGIIVSSSFPDVTSATIFTLADARLLHHYFNEVNPDGFTRSQQREVAGFGVWDSIANLARGAARLDPLFEPDVEAEAQGGEVSLEELAAQRYSPLNPNGVRATVYDHTENVYGAIDGTTIAQRPLDNIGVQYGLRALNDGSISVAQFLDLNRRIGGFDHDMNHVPERHAADPQARRRALESGRILSGAAGLAQTPVIDYRTYTDHRDGGDIHMLVHQFTTRQRLLEANGHADNHVMQVGGRWGFSPEEPDLGNLFRLMDAWILGIQADEAADTAPADKVIRNKPTELTDACWDNTGTERRKIEQPLTYTGENVCNELYPAYATPRQVAGALLANNVVSCHLRPLTVADYSVEFSAAEWRELQEIFSSGVCDWSRGDISQAVHQGEWVSFGPSPINRLY